MGHFSATRHGTTKTGAAFRLAVQRLTSGSVLMPFALPSLSESSMCRFSLGQYTDVNLHLVGRGLAWHHKLYQDEQAPQDRIAYAAAEDGAREAKRGLWSDPDLSRFRPGIGEGFDRPPTTRDNAASVDALDGIANAKGKP